MPVYPGNTDCVSPISVAEDQRDTVVVCEKYFQRKATTDKYCCD